MARHMQVPMGHMGRRMLLYRGKGKLGGLCIVNKKSVTFHRLSSCQEEEAPFSFLVGFATLSGHENWPFLVSQFYLIGFSLLNFIFSPFDHSPSLKASLIKSQVF